MSKIKRITPELQEEILNVINLYSRKGLELTWKELEKEVGITRAAMHRNKDIYKAYLKAKDGVKEEKSDAQKLEELRCQNEDLESKLAKANQRLKAFDTKYLNWIYNAQNHGLTEEKLNIPIPESIKTTMRKKGSKQWQ